MRSGAPAVKPFVLVIDDVTDVESINDLLHREAVVLLTPRIELAAPWLAERYDRGLAPLAPAVLAPRAGLGGRAVHVYAIRAQDRDALQAHLAGHGIETVVCCPLPLHLQPAFAGLGYGPGDFPNAERLARECLALPLDAELEADDVDRVVAVIAAFYRGRT